MKTHKVAFDVECTPTRCSTNFKQCRFLVYIQRGVAACDLFKNDDYPQLLIKMKGVPCRLDRCKHSLGLIDSDGVNS